MSTTNTTPQTSPPDTKPPDPKSRSDSLECKDIKDKDGKTIENCKKYGQDYNLDELFRIERNQSDVKIGVLSAFLFLFFVISVVLGITLGSRGFKSK